MAEAIKVKQKVVNFVYMLPNCQRLSVNGATGTVKTVTHPDKFWLSIY